jgi:hypothetical protein
MPRKRTTPPRPYGRGKKPKLFLLTPEMIRLLKLAAKKSKMTQVAYLEAALENQFLLDNIKRSPSEP